mgnify:FL=1
MALRSDSPRYWLERALEEGWSARQLADAIGLARGASVSDVPLIRPGTEADVVEWQEGRVAFAIADWQPSGARPKRVRLGKVVEVLEREGSVRHFGQSGP